MAEETVPDYAELSDEELLRRINEVIEAHRERARHLDVDPSAVWTQPAEVYIAGSVRRGLSRREALVQNYHIMSTARFM